MNTTGALDGIEMMQQREAVAEQIAAQCGLKPLTARVLAARGICTAAEVGRFLAPSLVCDWHDPACIPGLIDVADKVESVMRAGGKILVFGDFDVDGVTATALLVRGLRELGADAVGLIPHRYDEGYALSDAAVERGMRQNPDLIVTVDCGISCGLEVKTMLEAGIDVAITDHHEPGEHVPQGVPLADPKIDASCPSRDLAGAGVALKLVDVLGKRFGKPELWRELTDLASLGTVADLMSLRGENRALVADGIAQMNNNPRMSIVALCATCGVKPGEISSTKLSFSLIPRINAAGRMGDATVALDLLLSDDHDEAMRLAAQLDGINTTRREVESELAEQVEQVMAKKFHGEPVVIVDGTGWHEGVKGIVASRISRRYKRPTVIFSVEDGMARGSGRTYGNINLFELAASCSDLFEKFGGHAAAIGITLPADKIDELRERMCAHVNEYVSDAVSETTSCDTTATVSECTVEAFQELELLQPFGNDNQIPRLLLKNVFLERQSAVGRGGNHLRYTATDGAAKVPGIFFGVENMDQLLNCTCPCDIVFEPTVDEWQGRYSAKLMTKSITLHDEVAAGGELENRLDELLGSEEQICDTGDYARIEQAASFNTKVVGVTFEGRQTVLSTLEAGEKLRLVRQPENEFDENAIAVTMPDGTQIGFLNRQLASRLAPIMDGGVFYESFVSAVTGGPSLEAEQGHAAFGQQVSFVAERSFGVNIVVKRPDLEEAERKADASLSLPVLKQARASWSSLPATELDDALKRALIGEHSLHDAQKLTLGNLKAGFSTLTVMATGRGKSLIFHLHAARVALRENKASVFIYPLRALVADQAFHLKDTFAEFGLSVRVLTGESEEDERREVFEGLESSNVDVVLTTPEFLSIHASRFAASGRIGFLVVDEAHHIGQSKAGKRPAYAALADTVDALGNPLVLAVTATASDEVAATICDVLPIRRVVVDPTVRSNLSIDDKRDLKSREDYIASLVASGSKCVIYVNSREQSMALTRMLRHRIPSLAPRIAFYNAGLSKADRKLIEGAFRDSDFLAIVSTSAFGEGVDIPDIEHVVLYHMPFSDIEFNQMSGRAGRNGSEACVHLLFSYGDARINERILLASAPPREHMVALYRALKAAAKEAAEEGSDAFCITNAELARRAGALDRQAKLDESEVSCGISVFRELGFLETSGRGVSRYIRMVEGPQRMELTDSVRYREGLEEIERFSEFRKWALGASSEELLARFNRPILPKDPDELVKYPV